MKTADWNAKTFHAGNAYVLAELAYIAYEEDKERAKKTITYKEEEKGEIKGKFKMDWVQFFRIEETEALVTYNATALILAFRGTSSAQDALTDAKIKLVDGFNGNGKIHEGFKTGLDKIWNEVWSSMGRARRNRTIWITGHSLGGALALTAAARLQFEKNQRVDGLYTFGQPRVGDPAFTEACHKEFGDRYFRLVHNNDVVTRVPTRFMGFEHTGIFKYINSVKQLDDKKTWEEITKDRLQGRLDHLLKLGTDGISDHSMINYVDALSK
jgi:triacylglycerol lipase